jgi:hypothetical protein
MLMKRRIVLIVSTVFIVAHAYAQCDSTKRPIVFIHGFLASGDTYARQIQRFVERGYCEERLFVFDWNSVSGKGKKTDSLLNVFINGILKKTGASQIDLIGHSAGGGLGRGYLIDSVNAAKVAHYIHLGSNKWFYEFPWFPNKKCLNIYSSADMVMGKMGGEVEGANNHDLKDKDHYEVATSPETFYSIYRFINDENNKQLITFKKGESMLISGNAVLLGSNEPMQRAEVAIFEINKKNGARLNREPLMVLQTDSKGRWGTLLADPNAQYEFELIPAGEKGKTISYFFEPFTQTNNNVYLRGFPQSGIISLMLGNLPAKEDQSVIVIYSSTKAMIAGRDSVTVNGVPVSSALLTPASKTVISSFVYDDGDGKTSGTLLKQYKSAPFIGGVDISLPLKRKKGNTIYYNGRILILPAVSSKEKVLLAVFN